MKPTSAWQYYVIGKDSSPIDRCITTIVMAAAAVVEKTLSLSHFFIRYPHLARYPCFDLMTSVRIILAYILHEYDFTKCS